jgi:hypothetical protein
MLYGIDKNGFDDHAYFGNLSSGAAGLLPVSLTFGGGVQRKAGLHTCSFHAPGMPDLSTVLQHHLRSKSGEAEHM